MAVLRGHEEIAAMLVRAGADASIAGPRGKTPLDVARLRKLGATFALLERAGADRAAFGQAGFALAAAVLRRNDAAFRADAPRDPLGRLTAAALPDGLAGLAAPPGPPLGAEPRIAGAGRGALPLRALGAGRAAGLGRAASAPNAETGGGPLCGAPAGTRPVPRAPALPRIVVRHDGVPFRCRFQKERGLRRPPLSPAGGGREKNRGHRHPTAASRPGCAARCI